MLNTFSIKDPKLFERIIKSGNWFGGNFLSIYILKSNNTFNQIGLGIGKKVGKAYKRNYVKRLIREAYTKLEGNIKYGYNIVFVWKTKALVENVSLDGISRDLSRAFKKAELIKNEENSNRVN